MEDKKTVPLFTQDAKSADISKSSIRCMGCMEEFSAEYELCPHCGYAVGTKAKSPYCLKPGLNLSGRYALGKVIGQGGFGITYIGWDKIENRKVAIKEFFPNALSTRTEGETVVSCYNEKAENYFKEGVRKMMDEGERLSRFNDHPNIVDVCDNFEENNTAYIVMEYLDGKSLKEYADENGGKLSPDEAVKLMMPVLDALNAMHKENMIHRDIAPDNIYMCNDGRIKLLDFGSARIAVQDAEKSLSVMVKPGYAPKEQYASRSKQGPWTDVYSVCATLYRLITGEAPVESIERDTTPLKTFASFGITGYDTLENIITKGLEPDYEKRLRNAEALKNVIKKTVLSNNGKPVEAPVTPEPIGNEPQIKKESKVEKKKKPIGGIIAAVVTITIIIGMVVAFKFVLPQFQKSEPEILYSGNLDDSLRALWTLDSDGLLSIKGGGDIPDYGFSEAEGVVFVNDAVPAPWYNIRSQILSVKIEDGITRIGSLAFYDCDNLSSVELSNSITSIGWQAFLGCDKLADVYYDGSEQQWNEIFIFPTDNEALLNADIHFNSAVESVSGTNAFVTETDVGGDIIMEIATERATEVITERATEAPTEAITTWKPTEVIVTEVPTTDMSEAEFVAFFNAETAKASRGTYNYYRNCIYTSPIDIEGSREFIDNEIKSVDENENLDSVISRFLGVGTSSGAYPSNLSKSDYALKSTTLSEGDVRGFTAEGDGVYRFYITDAHSPRKEGEDAISRFTNDFVTAEESFDYTDEYLPNATARGAGFEYLDIEVVVKVYNGKITAIQYSYNMNMFFYIYSPISIEVTCSTVTAGLYTDIRY